MPDLRVHARDGLQEHTRRFFNVAKRAGSDLFLAMCSCRKVLPSYWAIPFRMAIAEVPGFITSRFLKFSVQLIVFHLPRCLFYNAKIMLFWRIAKCFVNYLNRDVTKISHNTPT